MRKLLILAGMLLPAFANAQFTPGQVLTAAELNSQFALYAKLSGAAFTGGVSGTTFTGAFSGTLNGSVGAITPATGSFTNLTATGTVTLPAIALSGLATQAANTIVANATGSSASPTAIAVPSCSTSSSALNWTTSGGASALTCNTAVNAATLGGATFASPGAIGSGTASTGSFTGLVASGTVSGTGFVNLLSPYALLTSPTFTGTVTTAALTSTGNFTPSQTNGIIGTTTNNNANTGSVGEYIVSSPAAISLTNATPANLTSISLTAGDWTVGGNVYNLMGTGTTGTALIASVSTTSATLASVPNLTQLQIGTSANAACASSVPEIRLSLSATTTVYLVDEELFSGGTATGQGTLWARRAR